MIRFTIRSVAACALAALLATHTATANTMSWVNVPIPPGTAVVNPASLPSGLTNLDGFQSWDLTLDTTADWHAATLQVTLTNGAIFQEGEGFGANGVTLGQPDPGGFAPLPSSEFDSYVFDPHGGGAINSLTGLCPGNDDPNPSCPTFNSDEIAATWNSSGADTADVGIFSIARITLSPDAQGSWSLIFSLWDSRISTVHLIETSGGVVNGALVPEPTSLTLLALGGLGLLRRRRDRRGDNK